MALSDNKIKQIVQDAVNLQFPANINQPDISTEGAYRAGFIQGRREEATRSEGLVEALRGLIDDVKRKPNGTRYATHIKIAEQALSEYNKTKD